MTHDERMTVSEAKMIAESLSSLYPLQDFEEEALQKLVARPDVILCKECEYWEKQTDSKQGRCCLMQMYPTGSWYCGTARKRVTE